MSYLSCWGAKGLLASQQQQEQWFTRSGLWSVAASATWLLLTPVHPLLSCLACSYGTSSLYCADEFNKFLPIKPSHK